MITMGSSATEKSPARVATTIEGLGLLGRSQRYPRLPADGGVETFNEMQADLTKNEGDNTVGTPITGTRRPSNLELTAGGAG